MSVTAVSPTTTAGVQVQLQQYQQRLAAHKAAPASQAVIAADEAAVRGAQAVIAQRTTSIDVYA